MTVEEKLLQSQKIESEIEKINLERIKLAEEIKLLKRPLIKTPQYLAPMASIVIGLLAFIYASITGFWDTKKASLENQKLVLQIDIDKFTKEKDSIKMLAFLSRKTLDSLNNNNAILRERLDLIKKQLTSIINKYKTEKESISIELNQIDKLLNANKNVEAFNKLTDLIDKLNGITGGEFSNDFGKEFK